MTCASPLPYTFQISNARAATTESPLRTGKLRRRPTLDPVGTAAVVLADGLRVRLRKEAHGRAGVLSVLHHHLRVGHQHRCGLRERWRGAAEGRAPALV